ncbi:MAG TPA: EAL domain-containing protein [Rhodocyclaceae bacterium]|nr:EAL domain-containing protein [Rhodocyclaceae bacterium]
MTEGAKDFGSTTSRVRLRPLGGSQATQNYLELTAILENLTVGVIFTRNRVVVQANPMAKQMWGYADDEMIGLPGVALNPSQADYDQLGRDAIPMLVEGGTYRAERLMRRKDGGLFWCRMSAKAVDPEHPRAGTIWIMEDVSDDRHMRDALESSTRELVGIFNTSLVGIAVVRQRLIVRTNDCFDRLLGYPVSGLLGAQVQKIFANEDGVDDVVQGFYEDLTAGREFRGELQLRRADGTTLWTRISGRAFDVEDPVAGSAWLVEDISDYKLVESRLRKAYDEQQAIFANAAVGILYTRGRNVLKVNPRVLEIFGYSEDELVGCDASVLYPSEDVFLEYRAQAHEMVRRGETFSSEVLGQLKDGSQRWLRVTGRRIPSDQAEMNAIWIFEDVTERHLAEEALRKAKEELEQRVYERTLELATANAQLQDEVFERMQTEQRIWHMAHHDALTGLPNRALLQDRLTQAINQAARRDTRVAVMFIDLDRFKSINDSLGHAVGDELLKNIAERLKASVRNADTVCRLGGDEFVVVLNEIGCLDDVVMVAEKIIAALAPAVFVSGHALQSTPSIGISVFPDDGSEAMQLMRNADTAMYHAKAAGRNNFQFFTPRMNDEATRFFNLENRLRAAIDRGELVLHYQPLIDLEQGVCGAEALVRWNDPEHGMISPGEFIPVAEETGLVVPLGEWGLREAMRQSRAWQEQGLRAIPVSVNLSPRQFRQRGLVEIIRSILKDTGQPPSMLELEITEGTLMQDIGETLERLDELASMGVRLAIDDFGTGYSSLAYLKRFPVHKLKIDQSFVRDLCDDKEDAAIVSAIIGLARNLGLDILAEGVETDVQLATLVNFGCRKFQGYYFSRPLAPNDSANIFNPPALAALSKGRIQ